MAIPFPALVPSSRRLVVASWPTAGGTSKSGVSYQRLWGNKPSQAKLELGFANIADTDARQIVEAHDRARGPISRVLLPDAVLEGLEPELRGWLGETTEALGLGWYFPENEPPLLESVVPGRSTVRVTLLAELRNGVESWRPAPTPPPQEQVRGQVLISASALELVTCQSVVCSLVKTTGIIDEIQDYRWQVSFSEGWIEPRNNATYSGVRSDQLTISNLSQRFDNAFVRLKLTHGRRSQFVAYSNLLNLKVEPAVITITGQPQSILDATSPITASFTVTAQSNGGEALQYQWQQNGGDGWEDLVDGPGVSGATAATLTLPGATDALDGYRYRVKVSGSACATPVLSEEARIEFPFVFGLSWSTTVSNPCNPTPWVISADSQTIRYNIVNSANCGGTCGAVQAGTATATITTGSRDSMMSLDFDGIGELQDAGFETIRFFLNGTLVASAQSRNLNLGCSQFGPVSKTFFLPSPYFLAAGSVNTLLITFTTGDALYHVGCFYEVQLGFAEAI